MTLLLAGSRIPAISHDPFDLGWMGNSHIPQGPIVEFRQGNDRLFDLPLATATLSICSRSRAKSWPANQGG